MDRATHVCRTVRKLAVRLELLVSPSTTHKALRLGASDFEAIPEPAGFGGDEMSDGCGFIPDRLLLRLVGGGTGALAAIRSIIKEEGLDVKMNVSREHTVADIVDEVDAARAAKAGHTVPSCAGGVLQLVAIQIRAIGAALVTGSNQRRHNACDRDSHSAMATSHSAMAASPFPAAAPLPSQLVLRGFPPRRL
jgi:hypothetical protein